MRAQGLVVVLLHLCIPLVVAQTTPAGPLVTLERMYFHSEGLSMTCITVNGDAQLYLEQRPGAGGGGARAYEGRLSDADFNAFARASEVAGSNRSEILGAVQCAASGRGNAGWRHLARWEHAKVLVCERSPA